VLKIDIQTEEMRTVFVLEGTLAGAWVKVLQDCWEEIATAERRVRVLVYGVTFIDEKGKALLMKMHHGGAELVAEGCMNKAIVEEITQGGGQ
jgi:ribosomal protein L24